MPLTISNTVQSPSNLALQNKMNPPAIGPQMPVNPFSLKTSSTPMISSSPMNTITNTSTPALGGALAPKAPVAPAAPQQKTQYTPTAQTPTITPQYTIPQTPQQTPTQPQQAPVIQPNQQQNPSLFSSVVNGLANTSTQNNQLGQNAIEIARKAGEEIARIGGEGARAAAGYRTTGTSPVGEGNAAVVKQTTADQQQAVAQGAQTALQGNQQALTAQGLLQSALSSAGSLSSPQQVSYNAQYTDPTTGQPVNPQSAQSMQDAVALQVSKLRAGTTDPASAQAALAAYGQAGTNALQQALGVNFNPNLAQGAQSTAVGLQEQANQLQSVFNGVDANYQLLLNTASAGGINNTATPIINQIQNNVAKGLASNQAVINFQNTLAAVRAGYAQILGGGTTTVDSQHRAENAIPDNISLDALRSLGEQLKSESTNRIAGINQQIRSLTSGGSGSGSQNVPSSVQSGGYNFEFVNGKWVAK